MVERRKLERFDLSLSAKIEGVGLKGGGHSFLTKNISAGGAFLETTNHLPENSQVGTNFVVPTGVQIEATGVVLRSEPTGVAVRFDNDYKMIPPVKSSHKSNKFYTTSPSIH